MLKIHRLLVALVLCLLAAAAAHAQAPHSYPFRATNYDVEVFLHPDDQTILAHAKVDFVAEQVAKTVLVELHADLHVNAVKMGTQTVTYARDNNNPLLLTVALPSALTPGTHVSLTFDYSGPVWQRRRQPHARSALRFG